jgi:hypothetical protein
MLACPCLASAEYLFWARPLVHPSPNRRPPIPMESIRVSRTSSLIKLCSPIPSLSKQLRLPSFDWYYNIGTTPPVQPLTNELPKTGT